MFARRSIQRSLDDLTGVLNDGQLDGLVRRLGGPTVREQIASEWETIVLAAISRCSSLRHEEDCGGTSRPDVRASFGDPNIEFVADVCAVSDADMQDDNPIEFFQATSPLVGALNAPD